MLKPYIYVLYNLRRTNVSDSQVLGDLLLEIPPDEQIDSVYTDGAYDSKLCSK